MLKKRLITAAILVPLLLASILYAHPLVLLGLLGFILGLAAYEWLILIPLSKINEVFGFCALLALSTALYAWNFGLFLCIGLLVWVRVFWAILTYPASQRLWGKSWIVEGWGIEFIPLLGVAAFKLYQLPHGAGLLIYVLALVSVSDSGAYFVGKAFGRHPLIPKVSSGKTIEGAIGGLGLPMLVALIGMWLWSPNQPLAWFGLALVTVLMSMFGDLTVSMLKRRQALKDTGSILPGHGGVLDRLDSLLCALPWFYAGYYYLFAEFS